MDEENIWKLGLYYFVNGVLYANKSQTKVHMYLFSLVENEEAFFPISIRYVRVHEDNFWTR